MQKECKMKKIMLIFGLILLIFSVNAALIEWGLGDSSEPGCWDDYWNAQTFKIGGVGINENATIDTITLRLYKSGTINFGVTLMIAEVDASNEPDYSNILSQNTTLQNIMNALPTETGSRINVNITIPVIDLTNNTNYSIIMKADGGDISNLIRWRYAGASYAYGDGWYSVNQGGAWTGYGGTDFYFKLWGVTQERVYLIINLISPLNSTSLSVTGTNFTVNYSSSNYNFTNATYYIWNSTELFNNSIFVEITGTENTTTEYIDEFVLENYEWNVWACYENASFSNCSFADSNYSFSVGASIDDEFYNNYTYETSNERFAINISLLSGSTLYLSELIYNGTAYRGIKTDLGSNKYHLYKNIDIPTISGTSNNFTFYWKLTYQKEDNSFVFQNLAFHNQTVNQIRLGDCAGDLTNITLNFTTWDEEELTRINGFDFKATFYYWLGNGAYMENVSFNNLNIYKKNICINPANVTYYLINSDIEYQANFSGYVTRNYYFENDTINNITQHIFLYLLNSSDSTSFILNVVDQNQQDVEDALIYTQRYYPGLGVYKTVQIAKTDENGKSVGYFKTETTDYRFTIEKNGITELITSKQKVVPEETPYTLIFTIGEALDSPWANFDALEHLDYTLIFNSSTNITTLTYVDTSGEFTQARLIVKKLKYNQTDVMICNITSTESSASLICDLSSYSGSFIAQAYIGRSPETIIGLIWIGITTVVEIMGMLGLFLGWFIILVAGCAFFWHPIAGIVGINAAVIFTNLLGLVSFSGLFIFGLLAVSVILIFILKD